MTPRDSICPEAVAAKLARADTLEDSMLATAIAEKPRIVEMMWFIQWRSCQPGGLSKLKDDLLATLPHRFVTSSMLELGTPRNERYTMEQCFTVWGDFLERFGGRWGRDVDTKQEPISFRSFIAHYYDPEMTTAAAGRLPEIRDGADRFNWKYLCGECRAAAVEGLCNALTDFCTCKDGYFFGPWYCPDLVNVIFEFMDLHAAETRKRIATTAVVEKVFDAVDYAWSEKKLVRINGNSRFGKSEALKTWAAMYPGRARLVTAPALGNSNQDLVINVATAFGFSAMQSTSGPALRRKVEFVLEHGRVGILLDEAHAILPFELGRNTPPNRLNWLRAAVVDKGLPCVLSATPQNFDGQSARFERATKYNMDQWTGRVSMVCTLPEELASTDLEAVVRIHLPKLNGPLLKLVTGAAVKSQSYLKAVEDIASRARWKASKRNAPEPALEDFKTAIEEVVPDAAHMFTSAPTVPAREATAPSPRKARKRAADVIREMRPGARREILPADSTPDRMTNVIDLVAD